MAINMELAKRVLARNVEVAINVEVAVVMSGQRGDAHSVHCRLTAAAWPGVPA
jgi:hypothetical protein